MPYISRTIWCAIVAICSLLHVGHSHAQSLPISADQQALLNQLPPAQRRQALDAIRRIQAQTAGQKAAGPGTLREDISQPESTDMFDGSEDAVAEPIAEIGATLVIQFDPLEDQVGAVRDDSALSRLSGANVYRVDDSGVLELPGLVDVPVLGLSAEEIEIRLGAEPVLRPFAVVVDILGAKPIGSGALEPYGYQIFASDGDGVGFDPVVAGPVPADYVLGPGDSIRVQLYGAANELYEEEVSRDGVINLPRLGPVSVTGMSFAEFRADVARRVTEMLIGTQVSVTMGQLRTIRVFVLGDAERPGSYVVSSLATASTAIYAAGGISEIGSLRNVQLKRQGAVVRRIDLYDLLLNGDTSDDVRLQAGDVIFVPPVGPQVSVDGAVRRPAIYELRGDTSVASAVSFAGGVTADADPAGARVERIGSAAGRVVISVDVSGTDSREFAAQNGDVVFVPQVLPDYQATVEIQGHLHRPGPYEWYPGQRLTDLVAAVSLLRPGADTNYVLIRREDPSDRSVSVLSADLAAALENPASPENVRIEALDRLFIFDREFGRQRVIQPILDELELQARYGEPNRIVTVSGRVRAPGAYPLEAGMRVSDLIRAAGSLSEQAYAVKAELVSYEVVDNEYRSTKIEDVNLAAILRGDTSADRVLSEHDNLRVSGLPEWDTLWTVSLEGEVLFPGEYRIRRGETLAQLLIRAGGLTQAAFPEGAVFLRESLREREQEQIEVLARRLEADLTSLSLESVDTTGAETLQTGRNLLAQLRSTEAVGRLVIDLEEIVSGGAGMSALELRDGDRLLVPKIAQSVTVIGETQQNTSHLFEPGLSRDSYIELSGGLTRRADRKLIYVVRASGAVESGGRNRWFGRGNSARAEIRPGDTIVVPLETDRVRPLTFWTQVTQILYQAAIAVAAIQTFD